MHQTEPKQSNFNNVHMLQSQIMFKQLQELRRRQQLQELGNTRNQNYINQDMNLFGQVPIEGCNNGILSAASLNPLEQKILYNTDEGGMEHTSDADAMPCIQSGSWSALMQSAVEDTSRNDREVQEEWTGLSFQKLPESSSDDQPQNFVENRKVQNIWVDRNLQNASSPSIRPQKLFQNFNMNTNYFSQHKGPTGRSRPIQTSLSSANIWSGQNKDHSTDDAHQPSILSCNNDNLSSNNFSGQEFRGTSWLQESGSRNPYEQANHVNEYTVESENVAVEDNVDAASILLGASLQDHGETVTAPSQSMLEVLNKDDISNDQTDSVPSETSVASFAKPCNNSPVSPDSSIRLGPTDPRTPQSYSFFPSLSMGTFRTAPLFSHNLSGHIENQVPTAPAYSAAASHNSAKPTVTRSTVTVTQPSSTSDFRQHVGLPPQQDAPSLKPDKSSNLFPSHDSASKCNVQKPINYSGKPEFHEGSTEISNTTSAKKISHEQEFTRSYHLEEASNLTCQSQMSLQVAPSVINAANLAKDSHESSLCTSTTATSIECKQLNPVSVFPSDDSYQNLAVSIPKKRKIIALDIVPWHKEVNHKQSWIQDTRCAELVWAETLNRRREEVKSESGNVAELVPVIRAKRRLICTTQLMQQLFRPPPAVIFRSDGSLNCDDVAYSAARLALAGACSLTCRQVTTDVLHSKPKISNRTTISYKFSKLVEGYINRMKKLEGDLARVEKSLTFVDIKFEVGELEKFSIINRFARFHLKVHPSTANHSPSSHKNRLQRYVSAFPMPRIVPEGTRCLSL